MPPRIAVVGPLERVMLPPINEIRADLDLRPVASMDEFLRRAPLVLVASGKPFQYPRTDWGDAVQLIGACVVDPGPHTVPDWLASIDQPIVLVTTSSEKQADTNLVQTAMVALSDEPVHVVATLPAGRPDEVASSRNATVLQFIPHGLVLDRAVCAVTHGGMGATKRRSPAAYRVRRALRARPTRGRASRRGGRMRDPTAGKETVTVAVRAKSVE